MSDEWLGNLLAALISLRVYTFMFASDLYEAPPAHQLFPLVRTVTDRAPHLEYFSISCDGEDHYWKRVYGEWAPCNSEEFPMHRELRKRLRFETYLTYMFKQLGGSKGGDGIPRNTPENQDIGAPL